jgi:hypothetical protein
VIAPAGGHGDRDYRRAVAGAVVSENAFDRDAVVGEPGGRSAEHTDSGVGFLVGVDFGVGEEGVVVDDGARRPPRRGGPSRSGARNRSDSRFHFTGSA